jgi:hypothetical protein
MTEREVHGNGKLLAGLYRIPACGVRQNPVQEIQLAAPRSV